MFEVLFSREKWRQVGIPVTSVTGARHGFRGILVGANATWRSVLSSSYRASKRCLHSLSTMRDEVMKLGVAQGSFKARVWQVWLCSEGGLVAVSTILNHRTEHEVQGRPHQCNKLMFICVSAMLWQ